MSGATRTYPTTVLRIVLYDEYFLPKYSMESEVEDEPTIFGRCWVSSWEISNWPINWLHAAP